MLHQHGDDKSQLVFKANKALSKSRQKLTDKTGKLAQIDRGRYVQYRGLHDYTCGEVQAKNEWAESYQNLFNCTRGVVEAQTEFSNSHQNLVSSIETTGTLLPMDADNPYIEERRGLAAAVNIKEGRSRKRIEAAKVARKRA